MIKPNLFIVGAPKCGTTALYTYLVDHPHIYMSSEKEPHFLADDYPNYRPYKTWDEYLQLFADADPEKHQVVGEGSVFYLASSTAISNIYQFNPNARLIAMFRNPVDLIYSYHSQLVYSAHEYEADFETAWRLQPERRQGIGVPANFEASLLLYSAMGQIGSQTERMLAIVPREQVKLILLEDFAKDTKQVYDDVLAFLGVSSDDRTDFPRINANKVTRSNTLQRLLWTNPPVWVSNLRKKIGFRDFNIREYLRGLNTVWTKREPLPPALRQELVEEFRPEVEKLSGILNRDLSHWLS